MKSTEIEVFRQSQNESQKSIDDLQGKNAELEEMLSISSDVNEKNKTKLSDLKAMLDDANCQITALNVNLEENQKNIEAKELEIEGKIAESVETSKVIENLRIEGEKQKQVIEEQMAEVVLKTVPQK